VDSAFPAEGKLINVINPKEKGPPRKKAAGCRFERGNIKMEKKIATIRLIESGPKGSCVRTEGERSIVRKRVLRSGISSNGLACFLNGLQRKAGGNKKNHSKTSGEAHSKREN